MRSVVVNSSPLIALSGISKLRLLSALYGSVMIPDAVYREISATPDSVISQPTRRCQQPTARKIIDFGK